MLEMLRAGCRLSKPDVQLPQNKGMEALALAPAEGPDAYWVGVEDGRLWICRLAGACTPARGKIDPPMGSRLPAVFEMASGDLVIEHEHWDPVTGTHLTISVIDNPAANAAPCLKAQLVLATPMTIDNVEGVAVVERAGGTHRFYLITDNNFEADQRTLLMAFDWTPAPPKDLAPPSPPPLPSTSPQAKPAPAAAAHP